MTVPGLVWEDLPGESRADAILDRINAMWTVVWPKLEALGTEELNRPLDGQAWCPRELMAHLAHWNDAHRFAVGEHLAGREVDIYTGWRDKNDQWFGDDRTIDVEEAATRLRTSHLKLRELLKTLTASQWDERVRAWVLQCPVRHYREHLGKLTLGSVVTMHA